MAAFLGIKPSRLGWAGKEGIIKRDEQGRYPCETVTAQWLEYERALHAKGRKRSEYERQRARLTRAKAEAAERKLAMLDRALVGTSDIIERTKAVCLRIKSKLQAALPRIARNCYYAPNVAEAHRSPFLWRVPRAWMGAPALWTSTAASRRCRRSAFRYRTS